jgi:hypothetical protein
MTFRRRSLLYRETRMLRRTFDLAARQQFLRHRRSAHEAFSLSIVIHIGTVFLPPQLFIHTTLVLPIPSYPAPPHRKIPDELPSQQTKKRLHSSRKIWWVIETKTSDERKGEGVWKRPEETTLHWRHTERSRSRMWWQERAAAGTTVLAGETTRESVSAGRPGDSSRGPCKGRLFLREDERAQPPASFFLRLSHIFARLLAIKD